MNRCFCKVRLRVRESESMHLKVEDTEKIRFRADQYIKIRAGEYDSYEGPYEFTPTEETQTVACAEKLTTENIILNPIPNNYGLITWDGTAITVS